MHQSTTPSFSQRIKTVPKPSYSPDLAPCDFCFFPKLGGCRYETIEGMKEAVTKVIDTLIQEDFQWAFQKLLERYKCIAVEGNYFEGEFHMCTINKSAHTINDPRIYALLIGCVFSHINSAVAILETIKLCNKKTINVGSKYL